LSIFQAKYLEKKKKKKINNPKLGDGQSKILNCKESKRYYSKNNPQNIIIDDFLRSCENIIY
jgi:hypothetical protein